MERRRVIDWLFVIAWAAVIFAFSSVPHLGTGLGGWDLVLRKLAHMAEYAVLALLVLRASGRMPLAIGLATLYAGSDEIHQTLVAGRHGAVVDVAIDAAGASLGLAASRLLPWAAASRR